MNKLGGKSVSDVKGFLFSDTTVTVVSAIVATPIVLGILSRFQIGFIPPWAFLAIIGFVLFLVSSALSGTFRAMVQGISIATFLNALFATRFGATLSARIGGLNLSG